MDEKEKTIQHLKERDKQLREALEQLQFQSKQKRERTREGLHDIRVKLRSLKWAAQLLADNSEAADEEQREQLETIKHTASELVRATEDLMRTLEDPT